jgi:hypothetical protein
VTFGSSLDIHKIQHSEGLPKIQYFIGGPRFNRTYSKDERLYSGRLFANPGW